MQLDFKKNPLTLLDIFLASKIICTVRTIVMFQWKYSFFIGKVNRQSAIDLAQELLDNDLVVDPTTNGPR